MERMKRREIKKTLVRNLWILEEAKMRKTVMMVMMTRIIMMVVMMMMMVVVAVTQIIMIRTVQMLLVM